jgi:2-methylcitrate dehydratase PrpD
MGLDEGQIAHSLALAMDMACGTEQYVYDGGKCDTKDLLSGYAARNGITAARMAKFGFRGPPGALDGPYGYLHAFGDGFDPAILDHLGSRSELGETGFKPHAGCRYVHGCVDAVQELLRAGAPPLEQIARIQIGTYRAAMTPSFRVDPQPESVAKASFSLFAAVSVALVRGSWYADDIRAFDHPEIRRLWPLVEVYLDEQIEADYPAKNGCVVTVTTTDGTDHVGRVDYAKGEPENMLTDDEFEAKFRRLNGDLLPPQRVDQIMATVARLEELKDISELIGLTVLAPQ